MIKIENKKEFIKKVISYFKIDNKGLFYGFSFNNKNEGFIEYNNGDAKSICSYYVKKQKFYLNDESKDIINKWSSKYYRPLNMVLRSIIKVPEEKEEELKEFTDKLSNLIESSKGLEDDVLLFRGEINVDLNRFKINETNQFIGFTSTSFSRRVGKKFTINPNDKNNYLIVIKAKRKTKGIAIDGEKLGDYDNQSEWLLNTKTKYRTNNIDIENNIIYIELI